MINHASDTLRHVKPSCGKVEPTSSVEKALRWQAFEPCHGGGVAGWVSLDPVNHAGVFHIDTLLMKRCDACSICKEQARAGKDEQTEARGSMQVGAVLQQRGAQVYRRRKE